VCRASRGLARDKRFEDNRVAVLSIAIDPPGSWEREARSRTIRLPLLSDPNARVSKAYGVMRWAVGAEPGLTFVLIDEGGHIRWLRDYGAPENGGLMYVEPKDIYQAVSSFVSDSEE
jgi:peroxiredoxin